MEFKYKVHGATEAKATVIANVGGQDIPVEVRSLEVELTPVDSKNGTTVLRFVGADIEAARERFKADAEITLAVL